MTEPVHPDIEVRLHALLSGDCDERERQQTLLLLTRDEPARRVLREMIVTQEQSRAAFGYDAADDVIPLYAATLRDTRVEQFQPAGLPGAPEPAAALLGSRAARRLSRALPIALAALAGLAAGVLVGLLV